MEHTANRQVTVQDMALAREARAGRQRDLLNEFGCTLISFTLNIPGPEKTNPLIERAFSLATTQLLDTLKAYALPLLHRESSLLFTGPCAFLVVQASATRVKKLCVALEDRDPFGRLLDLDVWESPGNQVSRQTLGLPPRACLVCGKPGPVCAAGRLHSGGEAYATALGLIKARLNRQFDEKAASLAVRALLYELSVTPKPGLVDRNNTGAHKDMDTYTFSSSASCLFPFFATCARLGRELGDTAACLAALRAEGVLAEGEMLRFTGGVNTHKGALFTLGILVACASSLYAEEKPLSPGNLASASVRMTAQALEQERLELTGASTYGETLMQGRLSGARAEAARGFPSVMMAGLPALDKALNQGLGMDRAGAMALLAILSRTEDTVLLRRAGDIGTERALNQVRSLLAEGCSTEGLQALDAEFSQKGLSPGGSADLLAAAILVKSLRDEWGESTGQDP